MTDTQWWLPVEQRFPLDEDAILSGDPQQLYEYQRKLILTLNDMYKDISNAMNVKRDLEDIDGDLGDITGSLDDIDDGSTFAKVLAASLSAGQVLLSAAAGDIDDITDGTTYGKVLLADLDGGHIILGNTVGDLDDVDDGTTYSKVLATDISAGHILLAQATGDIDDIADGSSYGKVLLTSISAGQILLSQTVGSTDDITEGDNVYAKQLPSDENLAGYWSFDDGVGSIAVDNSGNGHNLTILGSSPSWVQGRSGNALSLPGTDEYASVADHADLDVGVGDFSISMWVKFPTQADYYTFIGKGEPFSTSPGWRIAWRGDLGDIIQFQAYDDAQYSVNFDVASLNLDDDLWHHIVITVDRDTEIRLYVDGIFIDNDTNINGYQDTFSNSDGLLIGKYASNYFNLDVCNVRFYRYYELIDSEVKALYLNPSGNQSATVNGFGTPSAWHNIITASGSAIYNNTTLRALYGTEIELYDSGGTKKVDIGTSALYLGDQSNEHVKLSSSGMDIKDGATVLANYGSTTTIGQVAASQNNILISSGAMYFRNNTTNIISITSDGVPAISLPSNGTINLAGNDSTPAKIIMSGSTASCEQYVDTYGNYLIYNKTDSTHYSRITFSPAQALSAVVSLEARYGSYLGSVYYSVDGIYNTFTPSGNKTIDLGLSFLAWDDCYADDFNNVADIPFLDDRDDLKFLMEMEGSGIFDERTGLEIINDDKLPDFVKAMKKDGSREILLDPDGKPYFTVKAMLGWHNGCIRQLVNEFRDHMKQFH